MAQDKYLTYRGDLTAVTAVGTSILFVTAHAEGQPTALYRLDAQKLTLVEDALPTGGRHLVTDGQTVWVAGADRHIYRVPVAGGKPAVLKAALNADPTRLAVLADEKLAVLTGTEVLIVSAGTGDIIQKLDLPEPASALAADPTGRWFVVGTNKGTVCVFNNEERPEFLLSESAKLHEGAVTALLFETDDLRFLSAGTDGKLLSTHARGKLEPEDKGRGNNHGDAVAALIWAPGDRLLSGGRDAMIKSWPRVGGVKPATTKDGLSKVGDMTLLQNGQRTSIALIGDDNTIRLLPVDAAGKVGELAHRLHGAADWAKHELASDDVKRRETALRQLAAWNDSPAIELITQQIFGDSDHGLRLLATELLADSALPRAAKLIEKALKHGDEAVRVAAFNGLRRLRGENDLASLDLAVASEMPDIGRLAVQALGALAKTDDRALSRLTATLERDPFEIREAAMAALETVHDPDDPAAQLAALRSKFADLRRLALVRLHRRGLYIQPRVQTALRRATEDADSDVRQAAFWLSLFTSDRLVAALRARDPELDRQLNDFESAGQDAAASATTVVRTAAAAAPVQGTGKGKKARPAAAARSTAADLEPADYQPLLQATASSALDTCLRGARGLAVLGDERALGLLLQLSREKETSARVEVARALTALADPRSIARLRSLLFDNDAAVRDAAFSALVLLAEAEPLSAADAGLGASHDDVRRRALQTVIAVARKKPPESAADPAWPMLIRALNDASAAVRGEAFKAVLNLQVGGGGVNTLRFVLQSAHADVRREVLTEAMAQAQQDWAWNLLLSFLNDSDPKLRDDAFEFATKKARDAAALEAALKSIHPDVRKKSIDVLVKKHTRAAQLLLTGALGDEAPAIRLTAIDALVGDDVREALRAALNSPHDDVHARAADALARHGEPIALNPLLELASAPEPQGQPPERLVAWASLVERALDGLASLGDPSALPQVRRLIDSPREKIRQAAGRALPWLAMTEHPGSLRQAMQHADPVVRFHAALGLVMAGEGSAAPLVFSAEGAKILSDAQRIMGAAPLGPPGEDQLIAFLDSREETTRDLALLVLMLLELKSNGGVPTRCLAGLAAREPRVRLRAARALDCFRDPSLFLQFVTRLFTDRGESKAWEIPPATVDTIAELVAFGSANLRARTTALLTRLFDPEQSAWDRAWSVHEARFAGEIAALKKHAASRKQDAARYTSEQLDELAFGAYVGLVREQGADAGASARVRQTSLSWLMEMARRNSAYGLPAQTVFMQALRDPSQQVRSQAFEQLVALGAEPTVLGAEALESGHVDQGVRGLELLSKAGSGKASDAGAKVLEQAMLSRTDDLAIESARLLSQQRDITAVAATALTAVHEPLRQQAVLWLSNEYDKSPAAREQLRSALASRYGKVRESAAMELATRKDPAAFDALVKLLTEAEQEPRQRLIVGALSRLGDPRTPDVLLDRLENDPAKTASAGLLLTAVGEFRQKAVVERLVRMFEAAPGWRLPGFKALLMISGHDQPIEDEEDGSTDRTWETKQFPRHDDVLAMLIETSLAVNSVDRLIKLIPPARWSRGNDVDPALAPLTLHSDDRVRRAALEAIGWRARKRGGGVEFLLNALSQRDPTSQFLAAEGLANSGRGEGISVLLSSVDFLPDIGLRKRAVEALGRLGDIRALDTLLKIATEDGHILQDAAAESLGQLGQTPGGDEVFKVLERLARTNGSVAVRALRGLRWLETPAAWKLIRERAEAGGPVDRATALELLQHHDDPATRDLLLKVIRSEDDLSVIHAAFGSARAVLGESSLEVHYAWLQNPVAAYAEDGESIQLLGERGDMARLFDIFPRIADENRSRLTTRLLARKQLPVAEAIAVLTDEQASGDTRRVLPATRVIGRVDAKRIDVKPLRLPIAALIEGHRQAVINLIETQEDFTEHLSSLQQLIWIAGKLGIAEDQVIATLNEDCSDAGYHPARRAAVMALATGGFTSAGVVAALETAAVGDDPEIRRTAVDALAARQPTRAVTLAGKVLPDRVSFNRLAAGARRSAIDLSTVLSPALAQGHYQGIALPHVIATGDVSALSAAVGDRALPEATRLGAIEGLGKLATEAGEATLESIGRNTNEVENLRKAAWAAVRRSKRARLPMATKVTR